MLPFFLRASPTASEPLESFAAVAKLFLDPSKSFAPMASHVAPAVAALAASRHSSFRPIDHNSLSAPPMIAVFTCFGTLESQASLSSLLRQSFLSITRLLRRRCRVVSPNHSNFVTVVSDALPRSPHPGYTCLATLPPIDSPVSTPPRLWNAPIVAIFFLLPSQVHPRSLFSSRRLSSSSLLFPPPNVIVVPIRSV